jgi:hypothetical protein
MTEFNEDEMSEARNILRGLDSMGSGLTEYDRVVFIARVIREIMKESYLIGYENGIRWGEIK